jgi:outer membrane autotransporter protein
MHTFPLAPLERAISAAFLTFAASQALAGNCLPVGTQPPCELSAGSLLLDNNLQSIVGTTSNGVTVTGSALSINSLGTISGSPAGIWVNAGASLSSISTGGFSNTSGTRAGIVIEGRVNTLINNGRTGSSDGIGVQVNQGGNVSGVFGNTGNIDNVSVKGGGAIGKIENSGTISNSLASSILVERGGVIGSVNNRVGGHIGIIEVAEGAAISNGLTTAGSINSIFNFGTILSETGTAIAQTAGGRINSMTNSGVIVGGDTAISGTDTLRIDNRGIIAGTTAINATGNNFFMANSGIVQGRLNITGTGADVTNDGVVWLSEKTAASTINGTYTQSAKGAALYINAASASSYGQLNVSGPAVVNGSVQLVLASNHSITAGQTLNNVVTAGTLTGSPVVKDNSLNLDFAKVQDGTSLSLTAVAVTAAGPVSSTVAPGTVTASGTVTAVAPGTVVQPIVAPATDNAVIDYCSQPGSKCSLPTTAAGIQQVAKNIEEPVIVGGTQAATITVMRDINRVIQARRESNLGLSSGDGFYDDKYLWMRPFGSWGEQKERNGVAGYDSRSGGIMVGTDGLISEKTRAGLAFTYANVNLDGNSSVQPQSAEVAIWNLLGYGSYAMDNITDVNFHAGIGKNRNKAQRTITGITTGNDPVATSQYDGQIATLGAGWGRTLALSPQTRFIPALRADYVWVKNDGYTESGASPFNLQVNSQTASSLVVAVDGKIRHDFSKGLSFFGNLGVGYDVINDQASINALIAGQPGGGYTTYYGVTQSPWLTRGGLALVGNPAANLEGGLYYDIEYRTGYLNQTASVKLRWAF